MNARVADRPRVLALSGSLRAASSSLTLLRAFGRWSTDALELIIGPSVGDLPHFSPDLDNETLPPAVGAFRSAIHGVDALLISCPEYVHGIPGSFKNALDWLVSDPAFVGTPVALINASPESTHADAQLRHILTVMNARVLAGASFSLPLGARRFTEVELLADERVTVLFAQAMPLLLSAAKSRRAQRGQA